MLLNDFMCVLSINVIIQHQGWSYMQIYAFVYQSIHVTFALNLVVFETKIHFLSHLKFIMQFIKNKRYQKIVIRFRYRILYELLSIKDQINDIPQKILKIVDKNFLTNYLFHNKWFTFHIFVFLKGLISFYIVVIFH